MSRAFARRASCRRVEATAPAINRAAPAVERELASAADGKPLDSATRSDLEPRLGADLADVRVHDGERSDALVRMLGARAFAYGRDVWFGKGELRPGSADGRRLIVHEVAHVLQRDAAAPVLRRKLPDQVPQVRGPGPLAATPVTSGADLMVKIMRMIRIMCRDDPLRAVLERIDGDQVNIVVFETAFDTWQYPDGRVEEVAIPGLRGNLHSPSRTIRLNQALTPEQTATTLFHEMQHWQHSQDPQGPRGLESEIQARIATEQMAIDTGRPPTRSNYRSADGRVDEAAIRAEMAASPHYSPTGRKRIARRYEGEQPVSGPFACPQLGDFVVPPNFRNRA